MGGLKKARVTPAKREAVAKKPHAIDEFLAKNRHPLEDGIQLVRKVILDADASIREEIKWNSISFCNEDDFFATVNLRSTDTVQLVLHTGVKKKKTAQTGVQVLDPCGLIERWPAKDRCIVTLGKGPALKRKTAALTSLVKDWIRFVGPL